MNAPFWRSQSGRLARLERSVLLACIVFALLGCGSKPKEEPELQRRLDYPTAEGVEIDDREVNAAMAKARSQFDHFANLIDNAADGDKAAVKIDVVTSVGHEYMWVTRISRSGDEFKGVFEEDAFDVPSMKEGDEVTFKKSRVADWVFEHEGHFEGDFTQPIFDRREAKAKGR